MRFSYLLSCCIALLIACTSKPIATREPAQVEPNPNGDWPVYARDSASTKYSPLNQIRMNNITQAKVVWRWNSEDNAILAANPNLSTMYNEGTPIAIDGNLYVSTALNQVVKINGSNGTTIWKFDPKSYVGQAPPNFGFVHRGVTYWKNGNDARIFFGTADGYLYALDASSGMPISSFGENGRIDLLKGLGKNNSDWPLRWQYGVSSPVSICDNKIVVGSSINDLIIGKENPPGDVRAFDPLTGKVAWRFSTMKDPDKRWNGNANVWTIMSVDNKLNMVYLPVSTPASDMYGGKRRGAGLYGESLVAVDCKTGRRKWHYQMVHHGLWDYDPPAAPNLVDIVVNGQPVHAVVQVTKQSFAYVLNRETGKPIWEIKEKPVPASTIEQASATQPFPTRPPAFDRQGITKEDLINFTDVRNADLCKGPSGQDAQFCRTDVERANLKLYKESESIVDQYVYGPLFTPPTDQKKGLLQLPGSAGGASWAGAAFHPEQNLLFVSSATKPVAVLMAKNANKPDGSPPDFAYSYSLAGASIKGPDGKAPTIPLFKPPYGRVTAINMNTGEIAWQIPLGKGPQTDEKIAPALSGTKWAGKDLGWDRRGQMLLTKSLLFVGQTGQASVAGVLMAEHNGTKVINGLKVGLVETPGEQVLKAIDPATGEVVHSISLLDKASGEKVSGNAYGAPMTFLNEKGKQVIVVPVGGANLKAELVAIEVP